MPTMSLPDRFCPNMIIGIGFLSLSAIDLTADFLTDIVNFRKLENSVKTILPQRYTFKNIYSVDGGRDIRYITEIYISIV